MQGKAVFKGTRLTVAHVLRELGTGMTQEEVLENYPALTPGHIQAALLLAADVLTSHRDTFSLSGKSAESRSPFNVPGVETKASTSDILDAVRDSRRRRC